MSCEKTGFPLGSLVIVKRGKYSGAVCVVVGFDENDDKILIADGKHISVKKTKRKGLRHVQETGRISNEVAERVAGGKILDDGWLVSILARHKDNDFTACS